jgi:hypothetical protein
MSGDSRCPLGPVRPHQDDMQVTVESSTVPFEVGGENVQMSVNTMTPPCSTVMVALVNATSVIVSVH